MFVLLNLKRPNSLREINRGRFVSPLAQISLIVDCFDFFVSFYIS